MSNHTEQLNTRFADKKLYAMSCPEIGLHKSGKDRQGNEDAENNCFDSFQSRAIGMNQSIHTSNAATKCRKHFVAAFEVSKRAYTFSMKYQRPIALTLRKSIERSMIHQPNLE